MDNGQRAHLRGMTWAHQRGIAPVLAASRAFSDRNDGITFRWDRRALQAFESQPLRELASSYDLIVIDHPHLGEAIREGLLVDLSNCGRDAELSQLGTQSAGRSHASYARDGGQWALAVDAATPVASYRYQSLQDVPNNWDAVIGLAREGSVIVPLLAPHALMVFFWLARNRGIAVAECRDQLMEPCEMRDTLDQLAELAAHLPPSCHDMDPIAVYDWMSTESDAPPYCPHGYGYISYARRDFRPYRLRFVDVVEAAAGGGVAGTVLGGTGIAVSALSEHREIALDFAFWIASAECQAGLWTMSGGQPGNARAWDDDACNEGCRQFLRDTRATLEAAWVRPRHDGYLNFQTQASQTLSDHLTGNTSQSDCVTTLQAQYRSSFA